MMTQKEKRKGIRSVYARVQEETIEEKILISIVARANFETPDGRKAARIIHGDRKKLARAFRVSEQKLSRAISKLLNFRIIEIYRTKNTERHEFYVISKDLEQYCNE